MGWGPLPPEHGPEPRPLSEALDQVLRGLGAPGGRAIAEVVDRWVDIVGPDTAAHARPMSLTNGRLVVEVDDPAWATPLRYRQAEVLRRLVEVAGEGVADRLEVRVKGP